MSDKFSVSKGKKIVFMGTPEFAATALKALVEDGYEVGYAVTKPDSQKDRGKKISASEVKIAALEMGIPVLQPENLKSDEEFTLALQKYKPDLIAVAAYGKILPSSVLDLPKYGCINIHASLLPKFRGAAPIQRAILAGETETGVTLMKMSEGLDTGDMLASVSTSTDGKTSEELFEELAKLGADLLIEKLPLIFNGEINPKKQDESLATYAHMIEKSEGKLDFSKPAIELERQIRAIPSFAYYKGELLKIWKAEVLELRDDMFCETEKCDAGAFVEITKKTMVVKCGENSLSLKEMQLAGKKRLNVVQFLNGNKVSLSDRLD